MARNLKVSAAPLRRISVYVDEPEAGWFAWALAEAGEGMSNWTLLEHADEWVGSYKEAMADGLLALQRMIPDLDAGPREEPPPEAAKPRSKGFGFGFGTNLS